MQQIGWTEIFEYEHACSQLSVRPLVSLWCLDKAVNNDVASLYYIIEDSQRGRGCMLPCSLYKLIVVPFFLNNKLRCSPKFTFPQFPCSQKLCSLFPWSPKIFLTVPQNFSHISFLPVHYLKKVPHWGKICLQGNSLTTRKEIRP